MNDIWQSEGTIYLEGSPFWVQLVIAIAESGVRRVSHPPQGLNQFPPNQEVVDFDLLYNSLCNPPEESPSFLVNLNFWLHTLDLSWTGSENARVGIRLVERSS